MGTTRVRTSWRTRHDDQAHGANRKRYKECKKLKICATYLWENIGIICYEP
jgi:hypothetical protein